MVSDLLLERIFSVVHGNASGWRMFAAPSGEYFSFSGGRAVQIWVSLFGEIGWNTDGLPLQSWDFL